MSQMDTRALDIGSLKLSLNYQRYFYIILNSFQTTGIKQTRPDELQVSAANYSKYEVMNRPVKHLIVFLIIHEFLVH